ncbi:MAG: hypothetical protein LAP85_07555 [Acidobacteriia bacterium]|nr:hypothetical protein [Terriglobia bacterium]
MPALLIFHLRAGVRIAVRSFALLFSCILAWIMLDIDPAAAVAGLATSVFARRPAISDLAPIVILAFLLPALAAPRLAHGLNGWIRHLAFDSDGNRRGMAAALAVVQTPLAVSLTCLAFVARGQGLSVEYPALRLLLVMASGVQASLPVKRRYITIPISLLSVVLSIRGDWGQMLLAFALLAGAEASSGPLREDRRRGSWRSIDSFLSFRIAWRALGWRVSAIYAVALLPLAATALFLRNNDLPASPAAGAARLGGSMAVVLVLAGLANKLAERRPAWPLARSFPWSSSQRVASDALFLGVHALPPVLILALRYPGGAACVLGVLPFLALRASGYIRLVPGLLAGARRFLIEGFSLAALLGLIPWMSLVCLVATPLSFIAARRSERALKVTCWSDLHHAALGDTLSWSE